MFLFVKIDGLKNGILLQTGLNQTKSNYDYPHCHLNITNRFSYKEFCISKVLYIKENDNYNVEQIYIYNNNGRIKLSLRDYTTDKEPICDAERPIVINSNVFERINALVKPIFDLLYDDSFIGHIDDAYLSVGHCFYCEDEFGWYLCRVNYIFETYFYCECISVDPDIGIENESRIFSAFYDFFQEYNPKYVDPKFFDSVWNMYNNSKEEILNILLDYDN